jgi:D-psicose/D-tagatose/L-ribulose 3-epimerase
MGKFVRSIEPSSARTDQRVRPGVLQSGLECTICSVLPDGFSAITEDRRIRGLTRDHMMRHIETAAEIGARVIAGPLYSPVGHLPGRRRTGTEWHNAVEFYQSPDAELDHDITIAIEPLNRFETYFLNTTADAVDRCKDIGQPGVGIASEGITFLHAISAQEAPRCASGS